jgi:hypothetical protein
VVGWGSIAYGALLSALFAAGGVFVFGGERRGRVALAAGLVTAAGAAGWNSIVRVTDAASLARSAPIDAFPASWKDAATGVWALAFSTVVLGGGVRPTAKAVHLVLLALLCGVAAFLVDVYLY